MSAGAGNSQQDPEPDYELTNRVPMRCCQATTKLMLNYNQAYPHNPEQGILKD
jgi:hypothetical protein